MDDANLAQVVPTCVYDTDSESTPQVTSSFSADVTPTTDQNCAMAATNFELDFAGLGETITEAAKKALIDGKMTPLIKEELKYAIQTKRLKEGKEELKVEFTDPLPDQLTPDEEIRVEKRRVQNREAAQRFRERQKDKVTSLQKKCRELEAVQTQLRYELSQARKERDELRQAYNHHIAVCPLHMQFPVQVTIASSTDQIT